MRKINIAKLNPIRSSTGIATNAFQTKMFTLYLIIIIIQLLKINLIISIY